MCAKEVVKDVNDSGDIPFGLTIGVLEGWVQRSCNEMTYFRYKISFNLTTIPVVVGVLG